MSENGLIKLYRTSQFVNSGRNYDIYINNKLKGKISDGQTKEIEVPAGKHEIYIRIDWLNSKKVEVKLEPGKEYKLLCGSSLTGIKQWLTMFYLFSTDKFVYLEPFSEEKGVPEYNEKTWEEIKAKGVLSYILRHGVIGWGIPVGLFVFLINTVLTAIIRGEGFDFQYAIRTLIINFVVFSIVGIFFGLFMWFISIKEND